jgi:hypothetical protein
MQIFEFLQGSNRHEKRTSPFYRSEKAVRMREISFHQSGLEDVDFNLDLN